MRPPGQPSTSEHAAVDVTERLGSVLSGWRLDAVLGQSATNTVFLVSDRSGRRAALRLMHGRARGDSGLRRRVFREVAALRRVSHPGTVAIMLADVTATGEPYAVMERLSGLDVARLLRAAGSGLEPAVALSIAARAADVLAAAHGASVVHRAVQPATVFPCADGGVRLLDFGLVVTPDDAGDQSLAALGGDPTPCSAPEPEVASGVGARPSSDVFSLGVVLGVMLSGPELLDAHETSLAERVRESMARLVGDPVRNGVAALVLQCLDPVAERRPVDGGALSTALRSRLDGMGVIDAESESRLIAEFVAPHVSDSGDGAAGAAWQSFETLRDIFDQIERALYVTRRFGWEHEEAGTMIDGVLSQILGAVREDAEGVAWTVRPHAFESRGRLVWEPRPPVETIPYHLFDAGFRRLRLLPGIDKEECRRFLRWLVTDPDVDLPAEDDLATAYWRHEFAHVRCDLVSSVVLQDLDEYDILDRELRELRASAVVELRASLAKRFEEEPESDDVAADTFADVVARPQLGTLSPVHLSRLSDQLGASIPAVDARLSEVVAWVWVDAVARGEQGMVVESWLGFLSDCVHEGDVLRPFRVAARIVQLLVDPRLTRPFVEPFEQNTIIRPLLEYWSPTSDGATSDAAAAELDILRTMLSRLGPAIFEPVGYAVGRSTSPAFLDVVGPWLMQNAAGSAAILGPLVPTAPSIAAKLLLRVVLASGDDAVGSALLVASEHPEDAIRLDAFAALARFSASMARAPFGVLLYSGVPSTRRAAIRIASESKLTTVVNTLCERATHVDFDKLPYVERQEILSAVLTLDSSRGEGLLVEMLAAEGSLSNADRDHTRELVADLLAEHGHGGAALRTLKSIAYVRFWTPKPIRDRARRAIEAIEKRQGGGG